MFENKVRIDDLPENQREIAEVIGLESYLKLSKYFGGGENLYVSKYSNIIVLARNREIKERYNGYNIRQLAREYMLSERQIRIIIGKPES